MTNEQIEASVINSFLSLRNDTCACENTNTFNLDETIFTSPLRLKIAQGLNKIKADKIGLFDYSLTEKIKGTDFEDELTWIWSMPIMSIGVAKLYHDGLKEKTKDEILCAI